MYRKTIALILIFILTGCALGESPLPSEMDPKDLPDGRAFEDEFTRSLLQSTEEVIPGYYPFLAKNGRWEMAFPENGLTGSQSYISKQNTESIVFTDWKEVKDISATIDVKFYSYFKPGDVETKQRSLQSNIKLPLTFKEVDGEGQTYYISSFEKKLDEETDIEKYGYAAYIQNENEAGGIFVIYSLYCHSDCADTIKEELEEAYDWIKTIQFLDEELEES